MPRRKAAEKRERKKDHKFNDVTVSQFINCLMVAGKKSLAENIFYSALDLIEKQHNQKGLDVFYKAIGNVKPILEVKSRRVGGATYQVPIEVSSGRRTALAFRWLIGFARSRSEQTMVEKLAAEFWAASKNEGATIKKREDTHRMAEANKAFAHFRW
ncbi:MAG: 30S ribosomal protein S7 [candidate division Zixibacteria bacterium]|nr:30S ribosomal protein S7 [candidate division Zixibacteria bacterium]